MKNFNVIQFSEYIITHHMLESTEITPMKLQKLVYYIKAWGLVSDKLDIPIDFYKWVYGPVNKELYYHYQQYHKSPIPIKEAPDCQINENEEYIINLVLFAYGGLDAFTLSDLTHKEDPWKKTPNQSQISNESILAYYQKQPFAKNFTNQSANVYYPLDSQNQYLFNFDFDSEKREVHFKKSLAELQSKSDEIKLDISNFIDQDIKNIPVS